MPLKYQRVNHINLEPVEEPCQESIYVTDNYEVLEQPADEQIEEIMRPDEDAEEENFMTGGNPAYHI